MISQIFIFEFCLARAACDDHLLFIILKVLFGDDLTPASEIISISVLDHVLFTVSTFLFFEIIRFIVLSK
jgi:hypothetical protein